MKYLAVFASVLILATAVHAVPLMINYQGKISVDGTPFTGTGEFKFAIVDDPSSPTLSYWSNDGTSVAGSEPGASISISVNNSLYHVVLGETDGMDPVNGTVFTNENVYLRVWFDDGTNGSQQLVPDQRITSAGFSFRSGTADDADTVDGLEGADLEESVEIDTDIAIHAAVVDVHHSKTTSFAELTDTATDAQIPDTITINYAAAAGDADTLDGQEGTYYDDDQPDDDSEVPDNISISNTRLYAPSGSGDVGIGTTSPQARLHVDGVAGTDGIMFPDGTLQTTAAAGSVPTGYCLLGTTSTPPSGYTYIGNFPAARGWWTTRANMPTPRYEQSAAAVNGKIYVMGGWSGMLEAVNEEYDPVTNTWATVAPIPSGPRRSHTTTSDGSYIYVIGGTDDVINLNLNERYDPLLDSWTSLAPMPTSRKWISSAIVNNVIYVFGGHNGSGLVANEAYDIGLGSWSIKTSMSSPRFLFCATAVNNMIYTMGGVVSINETTLNERYDPASNSWTVMTPLPTARYALGAAALDNVIYVFGGYVNGIGYMNTNEAYSPVGDYWVSKPSMSIGRNWVAAVAVDGKIFCIGGDRSGPIDLNEEFCSTYFVHQKN